MIFKFISLENCTRILAAGINTGTKNVIDDPAGDGAFLPLCTLYSEPIISSASGTTQTRKLEPILTQTAGR